MDNGNGGPGNHTGENFERSMTEAPQFTPEMLPTPEDKESDPGLKVENPIDNMNRGDGIYIDSSMLGGATMEAMQYGDQLQPGLGEVVSEENGKMKKLTEEQVIGTDIDISKFEKNGVSRELENRLDTLKQETNLYKQSVDFMMEAKKSLSASFSDRKYLTGGEK